MLDVFLDALIDSLKVLGISFIIYIVLSFFEEKLSNLLKRHKKTSPIIGASVGLIPQCGLSVIAADLYLKEAISIGCLFAVFFSCSDEALPILLSDPSHALYVIPLILLKFFFGFLIGFAIDLVHNKKVMKELNLADFEESHVGCCHHDIDHPDSKIKEHLVHPAIHSLKIFAYVFIVNMIFGLIIYWIGEDTILEFLNQSKYITPLVCGVVGLIPNCASSVLISELFILNGIPFGALFTGLSVNAGLGLVFLLKNKKSWKQVGIIVSLLFISSIVLGYVIIGVMSIIG